MRKRLLVVAAVIGLAAGGGALGMQSASAACEGSGIDDDPRKDGNEVSAVYVGEIPLEVEAGGETFRTDAAWIELQDDGEEAPVAVEYGWEGRNPAFSGLVGCSDWMIEDLKDELP